jgi:AI-2 transport protein TqsA
MSDTPEPPPVPPSAPDEPDRPAKPVPRWRDPVTVATVATAAQILIAAAAAWFLLKELAPVLRPLMVAIFLAYILMPYHARLRRHIGSAASIGTLAGVTAALVFVIALVTYASVLGLSEDLPRLQRRAAELSHQLERLVGDAAPWATTAPDGAPPYSKVGEQLASVSGPLLALAGDVLLEAVVVGMYLLFLLLEGSRFPDRVRKAYPPERAEEILQIAGQVSAAIVGYLRVKVRASLALAVPVGLILWACGVKFALLWCILTFLCNFIPYIGPVVALGLPTGFAFLWFGPTATPVVVVALLAVCHALSAAVVEPTMIGKAVGLSPLVLLAALAFWGLLWGIPGMFLAVPLTVVAVLVMDHLEGTRPVARLLRGG